MPQKEEVVTALSKMATSSKIHLRLCERCSISNMNIQLSLKAGSVQVVFRKKEINWPFKWIALFLNCNYANWWAQRKRDQQVIYRVIFWMTIMNIKSFKPYYTFLVVVLFLLILFCWLFLNDCIHIPTIFVERIWERINMQHHLEVFRCIVKENVSLRAYKLGIINEQIIMQRKV